MNNLPSTVVNTNIEGGIRYAWSVDIYINGVKRIGYNYNPYTDLKWMIGNSKKLKREFSKLFDKYTYSQIKVMYEGKKKEVGRKPRVIVLDDCFNEMMRRRTELKVEHFLKYDKEMFRPSKIPKNVKDAVIIIEYVEVAESIVSYLLQTSEERLARLFQKEFSTLVKTEMDTDTALELKARELLGLDLETYFKNDIRKNTGGKN